MINAKQVIFAESVKDFTSYSFKPQMRTVGPKYGKYLGEIKNLLASLDGNAAMDTLNAEGVLKLNLSDGSTAELAKEDLLIDSAQREGYESVSDRGVTVVIDTHLTPELLEEGMVREIVSKIQTMRKDSGFEVMDHIRIGIEGNEAVEETVRRNAESIMDDTLCEEIAYGLSLANAKEWNINGEKVTLSVEKI